MSRHLDRWAVLCLGRDAPLPWDEIDEHREIHGDLPRFWDRRGTSARGLLGLWWRLFDRRKDPTGYVWI